MGANGNSSDESQTADEYKQKKKEHQEKYPSGIKQRFTEYSKKNLHPITQFHLLLDQVHYIKAVFELDFQKIAEHCVRTELNAGKPCDFSFGSTSELLAFIRSINASNFCIQKSPKIITHCVI